MSQETKPRGTKAVWTCSSPECGKEFTQYPSQIADPAHPHCSLTCRSRHLSLRNFPMEARLEAADRYRGGEHTGMLAKAYGISRETLRKALTELGVKPDRTRSGAASWTRRTGLPPDEGDLTTGYRWCSVCRERKPISEFYWRKGDGRPVATRMRQCKPCNYIRSRAGADLQANRRKHTYGMTKEEFNRLLIAQDGRCEICRNVLTTEKRGLHVDHCHATGKVRGLLCDRCNVGLGNFRDRPELLRAAADYIESRRVEP